MNAATTTISSSFTIQPRWRIMQNFLLLWVDSNIDQENEVYKNTLAKLCSIINNVNAFTQADECADFLTEIGELKAFLVVADTMGRQMVPLIHDISQLHSVYIYCNNKAQHSAWTKNWAKIRGVYTEINNICKALQTMLRQYNYDSIMVSFASVNESGSSENFNQIEPSFMYTQIFKEILLEIDHSEEAFNDFIRIWRREFAGNTVKLNIIDEFERNYSPQSAIYWYTREYFLYQTLNWSLRTLNTQVMMKTAFFIRDLNCQLEDLNKQQFRDSQSKPFIVYRGQGLSKTDFEKLMKTKGGLISFNNLLSTSKDRHISFCFAEGALSGNDMVGVLFQMSINPMLSSATFASISKVSFYPEEEEILFSMHTVFRVDDVKGLGYNSHLWEVQLTLTNDNDPQLAALTLCIRRELSGSTGWHRLGHLLLLLRHFNPAEEVYNELLKNSSDDGDRAHIYAQFGAMKCQQGKYNEAVAFFEKFVEIKRKTLPEDDPSLTAVYSNIGAAYTNIDSYSKALEFFEKAQRINERSPYPNDIELAVCYGGIGQVYSKMSEYSKALELLKKAIKIFEKTLPPNHPYIATSYADIGLVYNNMGCFLEALEFFSKAQQIKELTLPPNHPDLATCYSNIGSMHHQMGDYSKALDFLDRAQKIQELVLPSNHLALGASYINIGQVHNTMGDYSEALEFYKKAHQIQENVLPPNHPNLAVGYSTIANLYNLMGEYSMALEACQKCLEITKKSLSPNKVHLASGYLTLAECYVKMDNYTAALEVLQSALEIQQKTFQEGHPVLATTYTRLARVYCSMKEHFKALDYFEKCFTIDHDTLPENHPDLAILYTDIGDVHQQMGNYERALSFHQKALSIQDNIKCNPLARSTTYINLGETYRKMKNYPTASIYFHKGLEICEQKLPKNHPRLAVIYHKMAKLHFASQEYNMAMENIQKALEIAQEKLSSNHSHLLYYNETFEKIRQKQ